MNRTRFTAAAVGAELGKSDVAVLKAAKTGRISRNADGTFDVDKVKLEWEANTNPLRGGARAQPGQTPSPAPGAATAPRFSAPGTDAIGGSLLKARTMREAYEAQRSKLAYETDSGKLIDRAGAERAMVASVRLLRDSLLGLPDRLPISRADAILMRRGIEAALIDCAKQLDDRLSKQLSTSTPDSTGASPEILSNSINNENAAQPLTKRALSV